MQVRPHALPTVRHARVAVLAIGDYVTYWNL